MFVGILQVELKLSGPTNLKERRRIVKSLKDRIRHRFEVAVAEVGPVEDYHESTLGIALVANEGRLAEKRCQAVLAFIENSPEAEVTDHQMEVL